MMIGIIKKALNIILNTFIFILILVINFFVALSIIQLIQFFEWMNISEIDLNVKDNLCIEKNMLFPGLVEIANENINSKFNTNYISNSICFTFDKYIFNEENEVSFKIKHIHFVENIINIDIKDLPKIKEVISDNNKIQIELYEEPVNFEFFINTGSFENSCLIENSVISCENSDFSTSSKDFQIKFNNAERFKGILLDGFIVTNLKDKSIFHDSYNGICGRDEYISKCVLGFSRENREILGIKIGSSENTLILFASIHGDEQNTAVLLNQIVDKIEKNEIKVPYDLELLIIPIINPDGFARDYRFTSNNVDLNRNFNTENWQQNTFLTDDVEFSHAGGEFPFSEPETLLISKLVYSLEPELSISYHSWGRSVTSAGDEVSNIYGKIYTDNSGYAYYDNDSEDSGFNYVITGDFNQWMYQEGYPAITVELWDTDNSDIERNLKPLQTIIESF